MHYTFEKLTLYHNPRCRKSREALAYLEAHKIPFTIRHYLVDPLTVEELQKVLQLIGKTPAAIVRKNEALWKSDFSQQKWSDPALLEILTQHPKLIERPIVVSDQSGVLARPLENLQEFLKNF